MRVVGLMSGTSADAIDAALAEISGAPERPHMRQLAFLSVPWPARERARIESLIANRGDTRALSQAGFRLGECLAEAALRVVHSAGITAADVDLIGSHGQTVWHEVAGDGSVQSTLQVGEAAVIAERSGITTVADFRVADVAAGGEGAPLVPLLDVLLLSHPDRGRLLLNIGGIANVTAVPPGAQGEQGVLAFDLGPGNALVDAAVLHLTGAAERFDDGGRRAAAGTVDEEWVERLMKHEFFRRPPPKSTGREEFGTMYLAEVMRQAQLGPADLVATLTALTARGIAAGVERFADPEGALEEVWVSGGGVRNTHLMGLLEEVLAPREVGSIDALGVPADAKEALAFAVLANETLMGRPGNLRAATGAKADAVLGKISLPPVPGAGW